MFSNHFLRSKVATVVAPTVTRANYTNRSGVKRSLSANVRQRPLRFAQSAKDAVSSIRSGDNVFIHGGAATPLKLIDGLVERAPALFNVNLYHIHTMGDAPYAKEEFKQSFFANCLFVGANMRKAVNDGRAAYVPVFLSQIPRLFQSNRIPLDVALINVSPPDAHGYCSLGCSVDVAEAAVQCATTVIAQFNKNMPRTHGDGLIHMSNIDVALEVNDPIPEEKECAIGPEAKQIGEYIASVIPDGACLQMGIGALPNAVLASLGSHRNLGIHTEMFQDGMLSLIEKGVITNRNKSYYPNQTVSTFVVGSRKLYDYIHDNPSVSMLRVADTNDPTKIARNSKVIAINSCIEIDATGQVCADSIGDRIFSGVGGQVDFMTGAVMSEGGKTVLALRSLDTKTGRSHIVPTLASGAGVVTTRAHVHYVCTEYGIVDLFGKNLWERATLLTSIAHPTVRDELFNALLKRAPQWSHNMQKNTFLD